MNQSNKSYKASRRPIKQAKNNQKNSSIDINKYTNNSTENVDAVYECKLGFGDLNLNKNLLSIIEKKGYKKPSEIQEKSILPILNGKDIVGIAGTGTGKTAAFLIPIIQQLIAAKRKHYALIITPTRELASQINTEFQSLSHGLNLNAAVVIGGVPINQSLKQLMKENHLIIGTPGRLQDMNSKGAIDYGHFKVLVLDEFDRMLDMGFVREVQKINKLMINKKQSLLFSATLDSTQNKVINEITPNHLTVKSKISTHKSAAINQEVRHTQGKDRFTILTDILKKPLDTKTILFCETKRKADKLVKKLKNASYSADAIHGNKSQNRREQTLSMFKNGEIQILVATDVVARGIDISDVELVINYQTPKNYADYVHRIGRTGRAGKNGRAITLID